MGFDNHILHMRITDSSYVQIADVDGYYPLAVSPLSTMLKW
jgi:hypothetical protein